MPRFELRSVGGASLLCALAAGCTDDPMAPRTEPFCLGRPETAILTFPDPNLEAAIKADLSLLPWDDLTCGQVAAVTRLEASSSGIVSVAGMENLTSLTTLRIRDNAITDVGPLGGLEGLLSLNLAANSLSDIGPLARLTELTFLAINDNGGIVDLRPLKGLAKLRGTLWLGGNSIVDLGPLAGLTQLTGVNAWDNEITDLAGLRDLEGLRELRLHSNAITDLEPLRGLTNLDVVWLHTNPELSDLGPLLDNPGLGAGATLNVSSTRVSCADVRALEARGAAVISDCG